MASLPPISATTRLIHRWPGTVLAASSLIPSPTGFEPVKAMARVRGCDTSALPMVPPEPGRKFTTPGGMPASSSRSMKRRATKGESLEGFSTTVLPATTAAVVMPAMMASGKFHGGITTTTPMGM